MYKKTSMYTNTESVNMTTYELYNLFVDGAIAVFSVFILDLSDKNLWHDSSSVNTALCSWSAAFCSLWQAARTPVSDPPLHPVSSFSRLRPQLTGAHRKEVATTFS